MPDPALHRVLVVLRTRDRPVLLARALGSVLSQTHHDWHLALVNDGGDPAPVDALLDPLRGAFAGRITVTHWPESRGRGEAAGAGLATPGAFAFAALHDDDDSWRPDFLCRTTGWLGARDGFVGVATHWFAVGESADRHGIQEGEREAQGLAEPVLPMRALLSGVVLPPIAVLLRHDAACAVPVPNLPAGGERLFLLGVLARGDLGVIPEALAHRHRRGALALPFDRNAEAEGETGHRAAAIRHENALFRAQAARDPALLPLLGALTAQIDARHARADADRALILGNLDRNGLWGHARHEDLQQRLVRAEDALFRLQATLDALAARPSPRPLWERALRRCARAIRGRLAARRV